MNVRALIVWLSQFDPEAEVRLGESAGDDAWGAVVEPDLLAIDETEVFDASSIEADPMQAQRRGL